MSADILSTPDCLQSPFAFKQMWVWNVHHLTGAINEETTPQWAHGTPCSHDVGQLISGLLFYLSVCSVRYTFSNITLRLHFTTVFTPKSRTFRILLICTDKSLYYARCSQKNYSRTWL